MSALTLAAAGGTLALPRTLTASLLPRVLGFYIAGSAGTIQLLDILVDRLALDDRIFAFAILLAVIGIPFAAAGALLADAGRTERRRPARRSREDGGESTVAHRVRFAAVDAREHASDVRHESSAASPVPAGGGHDAADAVAAPLTRRLELALSYRRIAELHASAGDVETAATHRDAWRREALALAEELRRLAAEADERDASESARPPDSI